MWLWWYVGKRVTFERSDGVRDTTGYGTALSSTVFDAYEDCTLGCGNSCGGMGERLGRPFDVFLQRIIIKIIDISSIEDILSIENIGIWLNITSKTYKTQRQRELNRILVSMCFKIIYPEYENQPG